MIAQVPKTSKNTHHDYFLPSDVYKIFIWA